jgi:metal-responsive CopG/Arc/MetJ family transcriptional regulator
MHKATGLSLPIELMQKIDNERGDVSRSRFVLRLIEQAYSDLENKKRGGYNINE